MKLALIIDDYLPHSTRVGAKMFHELACELINNGHVVTVITPYNDQKETLKVGKIDNVNIWQFRSGAIKDVSHATRALNESLLSVLGWRAIRHLIHHDTFDGVIYYSPSIFWGGLISKIKKRCQCPAYLVLRDIFPQWAVDAGVIKKDSLVEKFFRYFERKSYDQAARIGLMSENNRIQFVAQNPSRNCEVLRNWADIAPDNSLPADYTSIRKSLGLNEKVIFFYGGNIGHAQDMTNLMRLTKNMQCYEQAHFLYVGQGDEVDLIKNLAKEWSLTNFTFLPSVNQKTFKAILSEVDVGLFSLAANHKAFNFPGKLLGYMVQRLPILGSVNAGNDLEQVINENNAGYIHLNGEDDFLLKSAVRLMEDHKLRTTIGKSAFQLLSDEFSVTSAVAAIERALKESYETH